MPVCDVLFCYFRGAYFGTTNKINVANLVDFMSRYLKKVVDEGMRCSTLAPFAARYSDYDIIVGGHVIPKQVSVEVAFGYCFHSYLGFRKFEPCLFVNIIKNQIFCLAQTCRGSSFNPRCKKNSKHSRIAEPEPCNPLLSLNDCLNRQIKFKGKIAFMLFLCVFISILFPIDNSIYSQ